MSDQPVPELPLSGIRILELGMVFALPLAIAPLVGLGADVVKIESGARPDQTRGWPQPDNRWREQLYNYGGSYRALNGGKRAITLDLSKPSGRETFLQLVAVSDVVAENFTPRVLHNLDLSYDRLREVNPRIILLSSSGFGHSGPWQNYKAYGPLTEAVDGHMLLNGYADSPPQRSGGGGLGITFPDIAAAYFGTFSILSALEERDRTGKGQWLDLAHTEAGVATIPEAILSETMSGRTLRRAGNRTPDRAPQGAYPCLGVDRWITISVASDDQFQALTRVLDLRDLSDDPRFATLADRVENHDQLDEVMATRTRDRQAVELADELQQAGVEGTPVADAADVVFDPQLRYRDFFDIVPAPTAAPDIGPRPFPRPVWKSSVMPSQPRRDAPRFGEHTKEVLSEYLELDGAAADRLLARLIEDEVVADAPRPELFREGSQDLSRMRDVKLIDRIEEDYLERMSRHFEIDMPGGKPASAPDDSE